MNVAIIRQQTYDQEAVYQALRSACETAGLPDLSGGTWLVKPNILSGATPDKAVATHPSVIGAMVRIIFEAGAKRVLVGDSPAVQPAGRAGTKSGIREAAESAGAEWTDCGGEYAVAAPDGSLMKRFVLTQVLTEVDGVISVAKLKTHQLMGYTGAVKNLFGLIPGLKKSEYHVRFTDREDFGTMLLDLHGAVKPVFSVIDGIVGMEGPGPGNGYPRDMGILMASRDALAVDAAACRIIGYEPEEVPTWRTYTDDSGLEFPALAPEDVAVTDYQLIRGGKSWNQYIDLVPPRVKRIIKDLYVPRPRFSAKACIRCGDCVSICPADALTLVRGEKKPRVDYGVCVRCYCCHEICPADAIAVRRGF